MEVHVLYRKEEFREESPGWDIDYRKRRERTIGLLEGASLVVLSQPEAVRNSTTHFPYRQESLFAYLSGFLEPDSAMVIASHRQSGDQVHLFLRDKDLTQEIWTGKRLGLSDAQTHLGVDGVYPIEKFWNMLPELLKGTSKLYAPLGMSEVYDRKIITALVTHKQKFGKMGRSAHIPLYDAREISGVLRLKKGPEEILRLKKAALITQKAFHKIFTTTRPGMNESQIHGLLLGTYLEEGAEMEAYPAIVAGGHRGFYLHYQDNNKLLPDGEMLLVDSGCQFQYYCCDVTRTYPVGKVFDQKQKDVYGIVLNAQKEAISLARPGATLEQIHRATVKSLAQGLIELGALKGSLDEVLDLELYKPFYPHGTSHWIGMDVHDVGRYYQDGLALSLEEGMYFSVEPGLYFNPQDPNIPEHLRGLNVRIEDDVLISSGASEVLTASIPKDIRELEALR